MSTTKLAEALHDLRIAVIAHYGASLPETAIGQCLDEAAAALASYEAAQAEQPYEPLTNIESPFNACMHREHCKGWKMVATDVVGKAQAEAKPAPDVLYVSPRQFADVADPGDGSGYYLPVRKTHGGKFTLALYAEGKPAPEMLLGEDPRIEPVRNVLERICGTRQSATNFARRILGALDAAPAVPAPLALTQAVDAAMVEMKNIHPPLRRSECQRLIQAALNAAPAAPAPNPDTKDAERYRWLRRWKGQEHEPPFTVHHELDGTLWGGDLDAAIDDAIAASKESGNGQ